MPRVTGVITPSDSDDSIIEVRNNFLDGDWSELDIGAMDSLQFSEFSHPDYDKQSAFLRSDSHVSTILGTSVRGSVQGGLSRRSPVLQKEPTSPTNRKSSKKKPIKKDDALFVLVQREMNKDPTVTDSQGSFPRLPKAEEAVKRVPSAKDKRDKDPKQSPPPSNTIEPPQEDNLVERPTWGLPNVMKGEGEDDFLKQGRKRRPLDRTGGRAASMAYASVATKEALDEEVTAPPPQRVKTAEGGPSPRKMTFPLNRPKPKENGSSANNSPQKLPPNASSVTPIRNTLIPAPQTSPKAGDKTTKPTNTSPRANQKEKQDVPVKKDAPVKQEEKKLPASGLQPPAKAAHPVPSSPQSSKGKVPVLPGFNTRMARSLNNSRRPSIKANGSEGSTKEDTGEKETVKTEPPTATGETTIGAQEVPVITTRRISDPKIKAVKPVERKPTGIFKVTAPPRAAAPSTAKPSSRRNSLLNENSEAAKQAVPASDQSSSPNHNGTKIVDSATTPLRNQNEEKLIEFVRSVADVEVLHVVYDYLCEHNTLSRFHSAKEVCKDLLAKKERILEGGGNGTRRGLSPLVEDSPRKGVESEEEEEEDENSEDDEFDDHTARYNPYPFNTKFKFGEPSVSGFVSKVFKEGMLFRVLDAKGNYYFYNDTLRHIMMVRVRCVLTGAETVNDRAIVSSVKDGRPGEKEVAIAVLPEETNFLMGNVNGRLPSVSAKAVQTPEDFVPPSLQRSISAINKGISDVRNMLGQWERATNQTAFLKCCIKNKLKFTDLNFRPSSKSLFRPEYDSVKVPPLTWRRPEEYLCLTEVSETRLFRGEISCHLVRQGDLRNHTLIAGIAAIAMYPEHVKWLFRHPISAHVGKAERAVGCYTVKLVHNGWWTTFLLDDYLPACMKEPLFARCPIDPRRLWVSLMEKAYAKSLGSYSSTCLADLMEVMSELTGFPYRYFTQEWLFAAEVPGSAQSKKLFHYIQRCVSSDYFILVFTPSDEDNDGESLLRKRSKRLLPVNGIMPQFLPGRVYFITDAAYYEELDLKMVRLKNPWTWESLLNAQQEREKNWKYTSWYDQPDNSISMISMTTRMADQMGRKKLGNDERKGTMWLEWSECLSSFAGGGACYSAWNWRQYRCRNCFQEGFPQYVLQLKVNKKVEGFVTLTLEGIRDALDENGNVVESFQKGEEACGVTLAVARPAIGKGNELDVVGRACADIECVAGIPTFLTTKDTSMKFSLTKNSKPYYIIPIMDTAYLKRHPTVKEIPFVLSVISDTPSDKETSDFQISFQEIPKTCKVFGTDNKFGIQSTKAVEAEYQLVGRRGVREEKGRVVHDSVFKEENS